MAFPFNRRTLCVSILAWTYALYPVFFRGGPDQLGNDHNILIAGHRVLKVFNRNNSGLGGWRLNPGVIFQDSTGRMWVGNGHSIGYVVQMYDETTLQWTVFGQGPSDSYGALHYHDDAIVPAHVMWICQSRDNRLWFARDRTKPDIVPQNSLVSSFDGNRWEALEIKVNPKDPINLGLFQGRQGTVWFWKGDELMSYDGKRWSTPINLTKVIGDLVPQRQDATNRTRPDLLPARREMRREILSGLQDRSGYVWLGTRNEAIRFDPSQNAWREYPQINITPRLIYEDRLGRLWFADTQSIVVYDKTKDSTVTHKLARYLARPFDDDLSIYLHAICEDEQGQMLFGLSGGLFCYNEHLKKWELLSLRGLGLDNHINNIIKDRAGRIWIASNEGLVLLDR